MTPTEAPPRPRFPIDQAESLARALIAALSGDCSRIEVAGSVRRRKPDVGDIEIIYTPTPATEPDPQDMFGATRTYYPAERKIALWLKLGVLIPRKSVAGVTAVGPKNKLLLAPRQGIPVDLFAIDAENFSNYLVCRTGPASSNMEICKRAQVLGYRWNPYGGGFVNLYNGELRRCHTEDEVFAFVGLPWLPPEERR